MSRSFGIPLVLELRPEGPEYYREFTLCLNGFPLATRKYDGGDVQEAVADVVGMLAALMIKYSGWEKPDAEEEER